MIQSMTAYASAIIEVPIKEHEKLTLSVNIKSLNSKYFEATCKVPYLLNALEVSLHKLLKNKLHRGHIYITIKIQQDTLKSQVIPSMKTVHGYLNAIKKIQKECDIQETVSLQTLLQLPHILQIEEEDISTKTQDIIIEKIDSIVDGLIQARIQEGSHLAHDILNQISIITKKIAEIKEISEKIYQEKKIL